MAQFTAFTTTQSVLACPPLASNQACNDDVAANSLGLRHQQKLAPLTAQLTLRQRGVERSTADISYGVAGSVFGDCVLAWTVHGICWLSFGSGSVALAELQRQWAPARLSQDATGAKRLAAEIFAATAKDVRLHLCGSVFQLQVWTALLRIRPGYYVGYGDLAREIGAPRASRAVGQAVGANRVALLVPCHRVLAAGGRIGGFRWGTALKRAMLEREASALASDFT